MRYVAPARDSVDASVFRQLPLAAWRDYADLLEGDEWPSIDALNARLPADARERFVVQAPELLADGMHYEQRIAERGEIATRLSNWHDLFNALIWLRYPSIKQALNARQIAEIAHMGTRERSRPQYAQTHFDEAGVIVGVSDASLLALWDAHDWHGLFWRRREAWLDGSIRMQVFGHALLEHALTAGKLLVGKAVVFLVPRGGGVDLVAGCARGIARGELLRDPLELRPLPMSGAPGWHVDSGREMFHREAACYQPLRAGRCYPAPLDGSSLL